MDGEASPNRPVSSGGTVLQSYHQPSAGSPSPSYNGTVHILQYSENHRTKRIDVYIYIECRVLRCLKLSFIPE